MRRTVTLDLGSRKYKFSTTDPQREVEKTMNEIKEEFKNYSDVVDKYGYDRILLMILLNNVQEKLMLKQRVEELTKKLEERE